MISVYLLKSRFQNLLRPCVGWLASRGVSANQVTLAAMLGSIVYGIWMLRQSGRWPWLLLPLWLFVRMALNAVDGMLAREHGQALRLGRHPERGGRRSIGRRPIAVLGPNPWRVVLAVLTEFVGMLGPMLSASRRYEGPMGKSDRVCCYGVLALLVGLWPGLACGVASVFAITAILMVFTGVNRARAALKEAPYV